MFEKQEKMVEETLQMTKATKFNNLRIMRKAYEDWSEGMLEERLHYRKVVETFQFRKGKKILKKWNYAVPQFRSENRKEEEFWDVKYQTPMKLWRLRLLFTTWKKDVRSAKKEKNVEKHKKILWEKVNKILGVNKNPENE